MMSVAASLSTLMFSPDPGQQGVGAARSARPGPAQLLHSIQGSVTARLSEREELWLWVESETVSWGQIGDTSVSSSKTRGSLSIVMGLCLNQLVSLRQGLMRIIKKPISQSLRRVFGCYLTQDQFYLLLFFYRALKLSLSIDDDTGFSGWYYFRITHYRQW